MTTGGDSQTTNSRLDAVASLIPPGSTVADIGTDHGLLPRALLDTGRAVRCIAGELRDEPLENLRRRAAGAVREGRLEARKGSGLSILREGEIVDVAVLAGLGRRTIERILNDAARSGPWPFRRLVVQPQTEVAGIRRWILDRRWAIAGERIVRDGGRYYFVIAAESESRCAAPSGPDRELIVEAGPCLLRSGDPLVRRYWRRRLRETLRILDRASSGSGRAAARRRLEIARRVLAALPPDRL